MYFLIAYNFEKLNFKCAYIELLFRHLGLFNNFASNTHVKGTRDCLLRCRILDV